MRTKEELIHFLENDFQELLNKVSEETKPIWGTMDAQRMIEHLAMGVKIADWKFTIPVEKIDPRSAKLKIISLLSDKPFPREFQNPIMSAGLQPYQNESLIIAKEKLMEEVEEFHHYYNLNGPASTCVHNLFGALNYHEWLWFQYKHILHHFMQFGMVPLRDRIS